MANGLTNGHVNGATNEATNGHANGCVNGHVNGEPKQDHTKAKEGIERLYIFSSYDQDGVPRVQGEYTKYLEMKRTNAEASVDAQFLDDLAYTLGSKRTHHAWRSFIVAGPRGALQEALSESSFPVRAKSEPRLGFVFTGQGAQWPAMGMELMAYPMFQQSVFAADKYLNDLGCSWSLTCMTSPQPMIIVSGTWLTHIPDELSKGASSRIDDPEFCQPICTAVQIALVDLLNSWGIYPSAITDTPSGEVAGAYAARCHLG